MEACELANLDCIYIVEEPVAAALYRGIMLKVFSNKKIEKWFIFDFGGGTLDVAIVELGKNTLRTVAVDGDNHLGG